jgi:hypothetical protein
MEMSNNLMLLLSLLSSLGFAILGNWMARRRDATVLLWTLIGFLFPPALLLLKLIHWTPEPKGGAAPERETEHTPPAWLEDGEGR